MSKNLIYLVLVLIAVGVAIVINRSGKRSVLPTAVPGTTNPAISQAGKLTLTLVSPQDGDVVNSSSITVSGKTAPSAEVFVNDAETKADTQGNFSVTVGLDEGENTLVVAVNDSEGNFLEEELTVTFEPD